MTITQDACGEVIFELHSRTISRPLWEGSRNYRYFSNGPERQAAASAAGVGLWGEISCDAFMPLKMRETEREEGREIERRWNSPRPYLKHGGTSPRIRVLTCTFSPAGGGRLVFWKGSPRKGAGKSIVRRQRLKTKHAAGDVKKV